MADLGAVFCACEAHEELLRLEGNPQRIIATGGRGEDFRVTNEVISLDRVTKRCTTLAPMITARSGHATAVLDGKLFVMGGYNSFASLSSVECLDLETGQRSEMAPMITPRRYHGAAVPDI